MMNIKNISNRKRIKDIDTISLRTILTNNFLHKNKILVYSAGHKPFEYISFEYMNHLYDIKRNHYSSNKFDVYFDNKSKRVEIEDYTNHHRFTKKTNRYYSTKFKYTWYDNFFYMLSKRNNKNMKNI